jgi:hypothetical protein
MGKKYNYFYQRLLKTKDLFFYGLDINRALLLNCPLWAKTYFSWKALSYFSRLACFNFNLDTSAYLYFPN